MSYWHELSAITSVDLVWIYFVLPLCWINAGKVRFVSLIGPGRGMLAGLTSHEDVGISVAVIVCILYFCDHYSPDHHHSYYHHTAFSAWHYILITLPRTRTGYMNGRPVCRVSYNDISRLAQARWFVWDLFWSVWGADCNDNVIKINDLITAWTLQNCLSFQPFMSYNCVGHHWHSLPHCVSSETVPIISTLHHSATSQVLTTWTVLDEKYWQGSATHYELTNDPTNTYTVHLHIWHQIPNDKVL